MKSRTRNETYPLETNRDVRKLKSQHEVKNMPEKRLPAIVDRAVWEKIKKEQAGIRWDNVVDKISKELGGDQEEFVYRKVWWVQDRSNRKSRRKEKASA